MAPRWGARSSRVGHSSVSSAWWWWPRTRASNRARRRACSVRPVRASASIVAVSARNARWTARKPMTAGGMSTANMGAISHRAPWNRLEAGMIPSAQALMSLLRTRPADQPARPGFSAADVSSAAICPPNGKIAAEKHVARSGLLTACSGTRPGPARDSRPRTCPRPRFARRTGRSRPRSTWARSGLLTAWSGTRPGPARDSWPRTCPGPRFARPTARSRPSITWGGSPVHAGADVGVPVGQHQAAVGHEGLPGDVAGRR